VAPDWTDIPAAPPERVEAGPVVVRRVQASDASAIAAAVGASLDELRPWMPWATPAAADQSIQLARVAEADHRWESGISYTYSVLTASTGTLVGEAALHRRTSDDSTAGDSLASHSMASYATAGDSVELGYWIAAGQAGNGYGTSASAALTTVALELPGVSRVEIHCDAANAASAAVARRLGYRLDRIEERRPEAPGESGRLMIWVLDKRASEGVPLRPVSR